MSLAQARRRAGAASGRLPCVIPNRSAPDLAGGMSRLCREGIPDTRCGTCRSAAQFPGVAVATNSPPSGRGNSPASSAPSGPRFPSSSDSDATHRTRFPDGARAVPINLPVGDEVRERFSTLALGRKPAELSACWGDSVSTEFARPPSPRWRERFVAMSMRTSTRSGARRARGGRNRPRGRGLPSHGCRWSRRGRSERSCILARSRRATLPGLVGKG